MSSFVIHTLKRPRGIEDSDGSFVKEHSHSQKSESTVSRVAVNNRFDADDDDDPLGGGGAAGISEIASSASGPKVVPHSGAGKGKAAAPTPYQRRAISLREVNRENFFKNYGIQLTEEDEIDLDHTSCESSDDGEEVQQSNRRKLSHAFEDDEEDSFNSHDRESADKSAEVAQRRAEASDSDFSLSRLKSLSLGEEKESDQEDDEESHSLIKGGQFLSMSRVPPPPQERTSLSSQSRERSLSLQGAAARENVSSSRVVAREKSGGGSEKSSGSSKSMGGHSSKSRVKDCFLCSWGNRQHDMVNNEDMKKLLSLIDNNIGEIGLEFIALIVHRFYKNQIFVKAAARGQYLPKWRSRDILVCLETHNHNPKIKLSSTLRNLSVVQSALENRLIDEFVDAQGNRRAEPNVDVFKLYEKIVKLYWAIQKIDLKPLNFNKASENAANVEGSHWKGIQITRPRVDSRFIGKKR